MAIPLYGAGEVMARGTKVRKTTSSGACKHGKTISKTGHCVCRVHDRHQSAKTKAKIRRKCG